MYEPYWQLDARPFESFAPAPFYYPCEAHQGALLKLRYALDNRGGCGLLTGASGLGKTLLVQTLLARLPERFSPRIHLVFPQMPPDQLLAYLAAELMQQRSAGPLPSMAESARHIEHRLAENSAQGRQALVVVDEAQFLIGTGALETLRLLLNFEAAAGPGLSLLLVGQTGLLPALERMPSLEERLGVKCLLRPLSVEETISYVMHRMSAAGAKRVIFQPQALETIHQLTHGVPRQINRLADLALLIGFAEEQTSIGPAQIESVAHELVSVRPE